MICIRECVANILVFGASLLTMAVPVAASPIAIADLTLPVTWEALAALLQCVSFVVAAIFYCQLLVARESRRRRRNNRRNK